MPDISMCNGEGCPVKDTCYRHTAKAKEHGQSWFDPVRNADGACDSYIEAVSQSQVRRLDRQTAVMKEGE